jgi:protein gp37
MAEISHIEWTDATWNPVRGCSKISPGCTHCYAETFAERFRGVQGHPYEQGFDLRLVPERLLDPLRWPKPKMIFVNSMSDLFHENVPAAYIAAVAQVMCGSPWHTYQVLTKRSARLRELLQSELAWTTGLEHIWWGVSVECRKYGLPRLRDLQSAPAKIRFLSIEPLLEDLGEINLDGIAWVIVGGESGRGARPMKQEWVLSILQQCRATGVPFFFKQWGGVKKARAGRLLSGATYDEFPNTRRSPFPDRTTREHALLAAANQLSGILPVVPKPTFQIGRSLELFGGE